MLNSDFNLNVISILDMESVLIYGLGVFRERGQFFHAGEVAYS